MTAPTGDAQRGSAPTLGSSNVGHPSPARGAVGIGSLWFGLGGGAVVWSVLTIALYATASQACYPRMVPLTAPTMGDSTLRVTLLVTACVGIIIAVAAGLVSIRNWRRTSGESGGGTHWALDTGEGRTRFMAVSSLMTSAVFLLAILVDTAAIFAVRPCW